MHTVTHGHISRQINWMSPHTHTAFLCFPFSDWPYMFTNAVGPQSHLLTGS